MSMIFFVDAQRDAGSFQLSGSRVWHLIGALGYDPELIAETRQLSALDLRRRIEIAQRQFAIGHGREFSSSEVTEQQVLHDLAELDRLARRALEGGRDVLLL